MNKQTLQETGKQIPVNIQELLLHVEYQLINFDNDVNPYTDILYYHTKDGKTIKIPDNIQKLAIENHKKQKQIIKPKKSYRTNQYMDYLLPIITVIAALYLLYYMSTSKGTGSGGNRRYILA